MPRHEPTLIAAARSQTTASSPRGTFSQAELTAEEPVRSVSPAANEQAGAISGPIVLVGHSYGGAVITNAATGDPQVKALVYVDAFAPAQGQSVAQLLAAYPGSCVVPANLNVVPFPGAPSGVGEAYIKQSVFPSCMANGLPASEARVLAATQQPIATIALTQQSGVPAWQTIPSWAVVGTADHAIPLALQLAMATTAHAHITEVDAPHLSMISDPGTVTNVILQAVRTTS